MHSGRSRAIVALTALTLAAGCGRQVTTTLVSPSDIATLDDRSPFLKAHLADGSVYVLRDWERDANGTAIVGYGSLLDANRVKVTSGEFRLSADEVLLFETNVEEASGPSKALTVMAVVTGGVAAICAANPKACFGSCPTFYAPDGSGDMTLQAEAFSSSIAPALEATDVDMLPHARASDPDFTLRVTNEALETHVIRRADLLAAPRPAGGRVHVTSDGRFRETFDPRPPSRAIAAEGDCLPDLLHADGRERASVTDSTDLATREVIDLEFDDVPGGELGLIVASRQTLLTTFLVYQALAYLGEDAGRWLASLEIGGDEAKDRARAIGLALGSIDVLVRDDTGAWVSAGRVGETGPIAVDTRVLPLSTAEGSPLHVRLRLTQGMWRLDRVALVSLGREIRPTRVPPMDVARDGETDQDALRALVDPEETLVTMPGDAYEIRYRLPENPEAHELFLEATGYYLEWMRREWLAEENHLAAAQLALDPTSALRALAPAFKKEEAGIEHRFWNSRYARD